MRQVILSFVCIGLISSFATAKSWKTDEETFQGKFQTIDDDNLVIRLDDSKKIKRIPLDDLSDLDRRFAEKLGGKSDFEDKLKGFAKAQFYKNREATMAKSETVGITERLKKILRTHDSWLYVDDSEASHAALEEAAPFIEARLFTVYDIYKDGGFEGSDVPLPRLMFNGDVLSGRSLLRHLQFLKELNDELLQEEQKEAP